MNDKWIGFIVSVHLKNSLGIYQGQISEATGSTLTLVKAFHNGVPVNTPEVIVNALEIEDIKLIDSKPKITNGSSTVTVAKPIAKRAGRSVSMSECTPSNKNIVVQNNFHLNHTKTKPIDIEVPQNSHESAPNSLKNGTPIKKDKYKKKWLQKDEACFGNSIETSTVPDFDFEKNLALFNKEAVWKEINLAKPDVLLQAQACKKVQVQKYRHDENIIATNPTAFRQIVVPAPDSKEYVTDDGLIIPSITQELRRQLFAAAEKLGLSCERQTELMGRAATEMALQLLGGGHRLNPYNTHQWPTVVLLCGPHRQGAIAINCARHLTSHGVNTIVYTPTPISEDNILLQSELNLYKLTKNKLITTVNNLPSTADLIILALCDDSEDPITYPLIGEWTNQNRAPVLALDPPSVSTPGILTKFSLVPVLPLSHSPDNGKLYLCNLGYPTKIYKDVGIKYRSPFGPKFVIPLHPNDT